MMFVVQSRQAPPLDYMSYQAPPPHWRGPGRPPPPAQGAKGPGEEHFEHNRDHQDKKRKERALTVSLEEHAIIMGMSPLQSDHILMCSFHAQPAKEN